MTEQPLQPDVVSATSSASDHEASPVDVLVGATTLAVGPAIAVGRAAGSALAPVVRVALSPPLLPHRMRPAALFARLGGYLGSRGAQQRAVAQDDVSRLLDALAPRVAEELLRRVDVSAMVAQYVDLDALVKAVLERVDLVPLAAEIIEGVDLPEIIRESTGSMASDTVRGARMRGIAADQAVGAMLDRFLRRSQQPAEPAEAPTATARGTAANDGGGHPASPPGAMSPP